MGKPHGSNFPLMGMATVKNGMERLVPIFSTLHFAEGVTGTIPGGDTRVLKSILWVIAMEC